MPKKLKKFALCACVISLLCLCACGDDETVSDEYDVEVGDSLGVELGLADAKDNIFSLNSDLSGTFNPYTDSSVLNKMLMTLIFDTMFVVDDNFNVTSDMITSYDNIDGTTWTFYVDNSIMFHDGTNLTAYDVAYSLNRAVQSNTYSGRLSNMYGVTAFGDEYFMVTLKEPDLQFTSLLNIPVVKDGSINDIAPVGTGAYMLNEEHNQLVLWSQHEKAADMPLEIIYLKQYTDPEEIITAFEDSLIDLVTNDPTGLGDLGYGSSSEKRYYTSTNMHYIGFNQSSTFFCYPKFRTFLTYAIDRDGIVVDQMESAAVATTIPISPLSTLYNSSFASSFDYDMEKAVVALRNAGAEDYDYDGYLEFMMGSVMVDVTVDFVVCGDTATKVTAARDIAENLTELGITVNMRELSWDAYVEALEEGDYDMYYAEVKLSANFDLRPILSSEGTLNYGGLNDTSIEQYIDEYMIADDENRQVAADYMFRYISETAPIVPICFEKTEVLSHRSVITGANPNQYNVFHEFENWTIDVN